MARLTDADDPEYERELRAAWVTEPPKLGGQIRLADYDPAWPGLFEREAARIRAALGDRVLRLEHIGSTSVPGLAAKPITDINLHVHPPDSPEIDRNLRFRDHLRADPADRALYERTKRELAAQDWTCTQQYADAKSEVVEAILLRS
jgi:GrpB-like predicted nucleotidyltransferase (UPF0157 family)